MANHLNHYFQADNCIDLILFLGCSFMSVHPVLARWQHGLLSLPSFPTLVF